MVSLANNNRLTCATQCSIEADQYQWRNIFIEVHSNDVEIGIIYDNASGKPSEKHAHKLVL